jgi:hypothetical protein
MTKPVDVPALRELLAEAIRARNPATADSIDRTMAAMTREALPGLLDELEGVRALTISEIGRLGLHQSETDPIYANGRWTTRHHALLENRVAELEGDLQLERARNRDLLQRVRDLINTFGG